MADTAEIAALRTKIAEAKEALHQLMLGDKVTQVGFGTNRMTQWNQAKPAELRQYIAELEAQLATATGTTSGGAGGGRRGPIYPMGDAR